MCQVEERKMKLGRELDALVAEKVMGIPVTEEDGRYWPPPRPGNNFSPHEILGYSTSLAAVWEVVEMLSSDCVFEISREKAGHYSCGFYREAYVDPLGLGKADTAPHAICLAALKAVGVEI